MLHSPSGRVGTKARRGLPRRWSQNSLLVRKPLPDRCAADPPARGRVKSSRHVRMFPKPHDLIWKVSLGCLSVCARSHLSLLLLRTPDSGLQTSTRTDVLATRRAGEASSLRPFARMMARFSNCAPKLPGGHVHENPSSMEIKFLGDASSIGASASSLMRDSAADGAG